MDILISIGERLREIRESMGLSQSDFAAIAERAGVAGATRQSQANYEKGKQAPNAAYLAAIAAAGADIGYVLTGARSTTGVPATVPIPPRWQEAQELYKDMEELDEDGRRYIRETIWRERRAAKERRRLAEFEKRAAKKSGVTQTFHGPVGQAINGDMHIGAISNKMK